jgi:hypothetical protein
MSGQQFTVDLTVASSTNAQVIDPAFGVQMAAGWYLNRRLSSKPMSHARATGVTTTD